MQCSALLLSHKVTYIKYLLISPHNKSNEIFWYPFMCDAEEYVLYSFVRALYDCNRPQKSDKKKNDLELYQQFSMCVS